MVRNVTTVPLNNTRLGGRANRIPDIQLVGGHHITRDVRKNPWHVSRPTSFSENEEQLTENTVLDVHNHMVGHPRCVFINYIWLKLIVEHN